MSDGFGALQRARIWRLELSNSVATKPTWHPLFNIVLRKQLIDEAVGRTDTEAAGHLSFASVALAFAFALAFALALASSSL